jgi:predicted transcriptional regulator
MPKETLTVRIEPETREALDAIAEVLDRDREPEGCEVKGERSH